MTSDQREAMSGTRRRGGDLETFPNLWDTDNTKGVEFEDNSPYDEDDWRFYKALRESKSTSNPKPLTSFSASTGVIGTSWCRSRDSNSDPLSRRGF